MDYDYAAYEYLHDVRNVDILKIAVKTYCEEECSAHADSYYDCGWKFASFLVCWCCGS